MMSGFGKLASLLRRPQPAVGQSPHRVVHTENKWRLLRFDRQHSVYRTPIVLIPSMINRWYVLDLIKGRSLVQWLVAQGHDVYAVDWGTPGAEDRFIRFDDIAGRAVGRAIRRACRASGTQRAHVLGYCMGGTLSAIHAAAYGERIASLTALAAPVSFDDSGLLSTWSRERSFDVDAFVETIGNAPWPLLQATFHLLRPNMNLGKLVHLANRAWTEGAWTDHFLDGFFAKERWANDNVSLPGEVFRTWIAHIYRNNALIRGTLKLDDRPVRLEALTMPLHVLTFENDHIVPVETALPLVEHASSADLLHTHLAGGHIGAVVGSHAHAHLWPALHKWWAARDVEAEAHGSLPREPNGHRASNELRCNEHLGSTEYPPSVETETPTS